MQHAEIIKLQNYLQHKFGNPTIDVRPRERTEDSVEVYLGDEFIGVIYVDNEEGELSYTFTMAILDFDLDEVR